MERTNTVFLTFAFILGTSFIGFSQKKVSKKDQKEIHRVCDVFLRHRAMVYSDSTASTDSLFPIISEPTKEIINLYREYFYQSEDEGRSFPTPAILSIQIEDSVGCIVQSKPRNYMLKTEKFDNKWIVVGVGFNNDSHDDEDIKEEREQIAALKERDKLQGVIEERMQEFTSAWSKFRQFDDSSHLKELTTPEFFSFLVILKKYNVMRRMKQRAVTAEEINFARYRSNNDTSWCRVRIKNEGSSWFPLVNKNGKWLVAGVDDSFCTFEDTEDIQKRINQLRDRDKLNSYIKNFNEDIEAFMKSGDRSVLEEIATDRFIEQLDIYRQLLGSFDLSRLKVGGISTAVFPESQIEIEGDTAYFKHFTGDLQLVRVNGHWLLNELFCAHTESNLVYRANTTFNSFKYVVSLRFDRNSRSDGVTPPPPGPATAIDYSKTEHRNRLNRFNDDITYEAGDEQLTEDLVSLAKKASEKASFSGIVYFEFEVDNKGRGQNLNILTELSEQDQAIITQLFNQLGTWLPNDELQSSLTKMVLAIELE